MCGVPPLPFISWILPLSILRRVWLYDTSQSWLHTLKAMPQKGEGLWSQACLGVNPGSCEVNRRPPLPEPISSSVKRGRQSQRHTDTPGTWCGSRHHKLATSLSAAPQLSVPEHLHVSSLEPQPVGLSSWDHISSCSPNIRGRHTPVDTTVFSGRRQAVHRAQPPPQPYPTPVPLSSSRWTHLQILIPWRIGCWMKSFNTFNCTTSPYPELGKRKPQVVNAGGRGGTFLSVCCIKAILWCLLYTTELS